MPHALRLELVAAIRDRGIAARQFQRSFVLAEGVEVAGATIENGLLHIDLNRAVPDSVVQTINISRG